MYENERTMCDERVRDTSEVHLVPKAQDLLMLLNEIECMSDRLNEVLFGGLNGEKKCAPSPNCLSENIDYAMDVAKVVAKNLDKIIQRL